MFSLLVSQKLEIREGYNKDLGSRLSDFQASFARQGSIWEWTDYDTIIICGTMRQCP